MGASFSRALAVPLRVHPVFCGTNGQLTCVLELRFRTVYRSGVDVIVDMAIGRR